MSVSVTMPQLGESVSEGTVTRWLKQEGDEVQADEPLLEVSTDKVDTEIPSPAAGVLTQIKVREDETVEVGSELAVIGDSAAAGSADAGPGQQQATQHQAGDQQTGEQPAGAHLAYREQPEQPEQQPEQAAQQPEQPAQQAGPPQPQEPQQPSGAPAPQAGQQPSSGGGTPVVLPALGESVSEGTVTRWLKQEGDEVQADEPLLEVSTDKVDTEIPSPAAGVLTRINVREDETVDVGTELAIIAPAGSAAPPTQQQAAPGQTESQEPGGQEAPAQEDRPAPEQRPRQETAQRDTATAEGPPPATDTQPQSGRVDYGGTSDTAAAASAPPAPAPTDGEAAGAPPSGDGSAYVTPLVRKLATEHEVDLSSLTGTGVGGRIRKQDVLDAARRQQESRQREEQPAPQAEEPAQPATPQAQPVGTPANAAAAAAGPAAHAPAPSPLRGRTERMSRLRRVIAQRMVESLQVSAQLTTVVEVDVTNIARLRQQVKEEFEAREGVRLSFLPFFALATIEALKQHPALNASIDIDMGEITYYDAEHLGIAVDTERGLLVPVIKNAGDLNLGGLARKIADLAERTRSNRVGPDELSGGSFTLTNTGSRGALFDTPILNQPQVGILGTGAVVKRPVVVDDPSLGEVIAVRSMAYLALTYDHRLVDGADAARFLVTVKQRLEEGRFRAELGL
jgi:pyruvate dehydrogenase E2 component (dihydrolipoamide acetyltransferase)